MSLPINRPLRRRAVAALVLSGAVVGGARWAIEIRPRVASVVEAQGRLDRERMRLAATRAQLLRLGSEGIAARNQALRAEVRRREALAPMGSVEAGAAAVRERFATVAARYDVHAPTFEPLPPETDGEFQIGGLRIRAAGPYHAVGTWITESVADERLLYVERARLSAVPDSLTVTLRRAREGATVPEEGSPRDADASSQTLHVAGAAPLDAVVELVVRWYALPRAERDTGERQEVAR